MKKASFTTKKASFTTKKASFTTKKAQKSPSKVSLNSAAAKRKKLLSRQSWQHRHQNRSTIDKNTVTKPIIKVNMLSWGLLSSSSLSSCCHCLEVGWPAGLIGDLYQQKEDDLLVRKICCPLLFYQVLPPTLRCSTKTKSLQLRSADSPIHSHPDMPLHQSFLLDWCHRLCTKGFLLVRHLRTKGSILDWCCRLCAKSFLVG